MRRCNKVSPKFQKKHSYKTETRAKKEKCEKARKVQSMTEPHEEKKKERIQPIEKPIDKSILELLKAKPSIPYNFIRLAEHVIPAEFYTTNGEDAIVADYKTHINQSENISGFIDVSITAKTPLFIGGETIEDEDGLYQAFYGDDETPIIPGSSIKGMIKQIFKIVTSGAFRPFNNGFGDFEDRRLYFRDFASNNELSRYYNKRMTEPYLIEGEKKGKSKRRRGIALPGFLIKTVTGKYFIVESESDKVDYTDEDRANKKDQVKNIIWHEDFVEIHTGPPIKRKNRYIVISRPSSFDENKRIPVSMDCIHSYEDDTNRNTINLLGENEPDDMIFGLDDDEAILNFTGWGDITYVVPCHFIKNEMGVISHFGHGQLYRIAYDLSIGDHVPEAIHEQTKIVDLADAVFGYDKKWSGRLSFSDGHLIDNYGRHLFKAYPSALMSPKPTSFQFYLEQNSDDDSLNHWGTPNVSIRGYKMYWHQPLIKARNWQWNNSDPTKDKPNKDAKKIRPVYEGNIFTSRIYFDRLTRIELGALLFVLNLDRVFDKKICYKLGMGKSIGLGSVKLDSKVTCINSNERYQFLFNADSWNTGEYVVDISEYIDAFTSYRDRELDVDQKKYKDMLDELISMMDWSLAEESNYSPYWPYAVQMMSIDDEDDKYKHFKKRTKLDNPKEFIEHWSKQL